MFADSGLLGFWACVIALCPWNPLYRVAVEVAAPIAEAAIEKGGVGTLQTVVEHKVACTCDCGPQVSLNLVISAGLLIIIITLALNILVHCCLGRRSEPQWVGKGTKGKVLTIADVRR